ncbi:MAG: hypothetical protein NC453_26720, partial [Muribaculum sp.]|nr:hypothetical protein [Muribaculum sp.]
HNTFNVGVLGSSPRRITKVSEPSQKNAETLTVSAFFSVSPPGKMGQFCALNRESCVSRPPVSQMTHDCESIVSHLLFPCRESAVNVRFAPFCTDTTRAGGFILPPQDTTFKPTS